MEVSGLSIQFFVFQVHCMVKFVGFNRPAALFVVFCCEGLLAFFPVLLRLFTNCILSTAISVFSVVISYLQQSSN